MFVFAQEDWKLLKGNLVNMAVTQYRPKLPEG